VQILSTLAQNVGGVGVGVGPGTGPLLPPGGDGASTETCPLPYPDGFHNFSQSQIPGP